ncbi:hypothetical protein QOT17_006767 [Balamuthia mandrillaris]
MEQIRRPLCITVDNGHPEQDHLWYLLHFLFPHHKIINLLDIKKRILDLVKESDYWRRLECQGWKGWNDRGEVLMESFKRLALLVPQLEEEIPVFTWRAGKQKSIVDYVVAWNGKVAGNE